jgi:hypothetical protein
MKTRTYALLALAVLFFTAPIPADARDLYFPSSDREWASVGVGFGAFAQGTIDLELRRIGVAEFEPFDARNRYHNRITLAANAQPDNQQDGSQRDQPKQS